MMTSSWCDKRDSDFLVSGYTKSICTDIPKEINDMVLLFYFMHDGWDGNAMGKGIVLKDNGIIEMTEDRVSSNAFLTKQFISGWNEWRFRVVKFNEKEIGHWRITIGIFDVNSGTPPLREHFNISGRSYTICCSFRADRYDADTQIKSGSIIKLIVDMDKLEMYVEIDEMRIYNRATKIKQSKYRVGFNLYSQGDSLQIL